MERAIPVLPARDLDETVAFWGHLGFELRFEQESGGPEAPGPYLIFARDEVELHFAVEADAGRGGAAYVVVDDADELHARWSRLALPAAGAPSLGAIVDRASGMRDFELVDPTGSRVRFGHPLP